MIRSATPCGEDDSVLEVDVLWEEPLPAIDACAELQINPIEQSCEVDQGESVEAASAGPGKTGCVASSCKCKNSDLPTLLTWSLLQVVTLGILMYILYAVARVTSQIGPNTERAPSDPQQISFWDWWSRTPVQTLFLVCLVLAQTWTWTSSMVASVERNKVRASNRRTHWIFMTVNMVVLLCAMIYFFALVDFSASARFSEANVNISVPDRKNCSLAPQTAINQLCPALKTAVYAERGHAYPGKQCLTSCKPYTSSWTLSDHFRYSE